MPSTIRQFASPMRVQFSSNPFGPLRSSVHPELEDAGDMPAQPVSASAASEITPKMSRCMALLPLVERRDQNGAGPRNRQDVPDAVCREGVAGFLARG